MKSGTGYFMHAQTFLQAPSQTSAGLATLDYFERTGAVENSARMGEVLHKLLRDEIGPLPGVGFVTGKGLLAGVEFVEDRTTKAFDRSKKIFEFYRPCFRSGASLYGPNVGQS